MKKLIAKVSCHLHGKSAAPLYGILETDLTYDEIPKLQEVVRALRAAGGKVNSSCGLHCHVDASNHNRNSLKNLIGIMYQKEDMLFKALKVNEERASRWCQRVREPGIQEGMIITTAHDTMRLICTLYSIVEPLSSDVLTPHYMPDGSVPM